MRAISSALLILLIVSPAYCEDLSVAARVEQGMFGDHRAEGNAGRNKYRHPVGTLTFFGLTDGMTVMEIWPGSGWYSEVLAPAIRDHGKLLLAAYDISVEGQPEYRYGLQQQLLDKIAARPDIYDQVELVPYSPPESSSLGAAGSVDMIVTFRNVHGWIEDGIAAGAFAEFARVLKPGGILGVVQHRAPDGADPAESALNGYVSEQAVIDLAKAAGLILDGRSEVNANPHDSKDYEQGVWTLPPSLRLAEKDQARYLAIGESDRMALRFKKPPSD